MEISLQAGELVGVLYDALLKQYKDPSDPETLKHLNKLCVRLVFCLYAEDAGILGNRNMFHDFNVPALLLNQDTGGLNVTVNEAGMVQLHRDFKGNSGGTINANKPAFFFAARRQPLGSGEAQAVF